MLDTESDTYFIQSTEGSVESYTRVVFAKLFEQKWTADQFADFRRSMRLTEKNNTVFHPIVEVKSCALCWLDRGVTFLNSSLTLACHSLVKIWHCMSGLYSCPGNFVWLSGWIVLFFGCGSSNRQSPGLPGSLKTVFGYFTQIFVGEWGIYPRSRTIWAEQLDQVFSPRVLLDGLMMLPCFRQLFDFPDPSWFIPKLTKKISCSQTFPRVSAREDWLVEGNLLMANFVDVYVRGRESVGGVWFVQLVCHTELSNHTVDFSRVLTHSAIVR